MENIDFSVFSRDDFVLVEWINSIFQENKSMTAEKIANDLVFKLQLMVEETNNSMEEIAQKMALSIPKVVGEADVLHREASELCHQIVDVRARLICAEQKHLDTIKSLAQMDEAKKRMQDTFQALQEANNWTNLVLDVDEVFESGEIIQISRKLLNMQKSLEMLSLSTSDGSQHLEKLELLENLKNRFEKIVEPVLIDSFSSKSSDSVEFYSNLFKDLHRFNRFLQYYHNCLRDQLLKDWATQITIDVHGSLLSWLNFFYEKLLTNWKTQAIFCMKFIYPNDYFMSLKMLSDIFSDVFLSLNPSIEFCFHNCLNQISNDKLKIKKQKSLIELKQFTNLFVKNIEQSILEYCNEQQNINEFFKKITSVNSFISTIYQPFCKFNGFFLQFEKERLEEEFDEMKSEYENLACSECVLKLFALIRDSLKYYQQYLESYPILIVEDVIEDFLLKFLNSLPSKIYNKQKINVLKGEEKSLKKSSSNLNETIQINPNWTGIQKALCLFQVIAEFLYNLKNFQQLIHSILVSFLGNDNNEDKLSNQSIPVKTIDSFRKFDMFILQLDSNFEMKARIDQYVHTPTMLMNQAFNECIELIKKIAQDVCDLMFEYVKVHLDNFEQSIQLSFFNNSKSLINDEYEDGQTFMTGSSFSISPNEYITQIGQYLLTLPQHLEPFNFSENVSFETAFIYTKDIFFNFNSKQLVLETAPTEMLLDSVLRQTSQYFFKSIKKILSNFNSELNENKEASLLMVNFRKQIGTDLSYLAAVFEDLGLTQNDSNYLLFNRLFNEIQSAENFEKLKDEFPNEHEMFENYKKLFKF